MTAPSAAAVPPLERRLLLIRRILESIPVDDTELARAKPIINPSPSPSHEDRATPSLRDRARARENPAA